PAPSAPRGLAEGGEIHDLAASGRVLEEARDLMGEVREARSAETHRGRGEVESAAGDATGDLRNAVPAVAEALEDRVEIGEEVHVRRRARAELLPERELARRASEVALPDRRQARAIRPARQSFDGVHDHERLDEVRAERVAGAPCTGDRDRSLELLARDVPIREAPRRAPPDRKS